jgi:hypothetical protein
MHHEWLYPILMLTERNEGNQGKAEEVRILDSHPICPKFVTEAVMCIKTKYEEKGRSITTAL